MDATLEETIRTRMAEEKNRTEPPADAVEVPPIPVGRYVDPAFYELEQRHIWERSWLFAGHASQLPEPGSYLRFERSGSPIVIVRGVDGEIRAFYNSCRHRGAPVVRDECGTAKRLTCQYHSWSYGLEGQLKAVPDSRSFVDLDLESLALQPVRCETFQDWIFVNEDPAAAPLTESLGPLVDQMAEIDGPSLRRLGTQTHRIGANWKVVVDAFVEVYHVRTVHPDNAALLYEDQGVTVTMLANGHSRLTVPKHEHMVELVAPSPDGDNPSVGSLWRETSTSFALFPNVIAPMDTGAFAFLCAWPVDVRTTELELAWWAPDWGDGEPPDEHTMRMTLFETVMGQDTANMAPIQASIESPGAQPFRIGWHERLIHHFHRAVDLAIGADEVPDELAVSDALDDFVGLV